jgi:hypothetical protein
MGDCGVVESVQFRRGLRLLEESHDEAKQLHWFGVVTGLPFEARLCILGGIEDLRYLVNAEVSLNPPLRFRDSEQRIQTWPAVAHGGCSKASLAGPALATGFAVSTPAAIGAHLAGRST